MRAKGSEKAGISEQKKRVDVSAITLDNTAHQSKYVPTLKEVHTMAKKKDKANIITFAGLTGDETSRLESLIESKESLIKKAIGTDNLRIEEEDGKIKFPWFRDDADTDEIRAYTQLCSALCKMAKESKRITGKDKPVENEKYAFRCFLLRLGFIGDEYKVSRKILLRNLSGSAAYKSGDASNEIS